jgi:hypothetical protein
MEKAPLAREAAGRNPTDRGKKGTKRSVAVESSGLPLGIVLDGAKWHDVKLLEDTLKSIVSAHPEGMNLCLDAGYIGSQKLVEQKGYKAHICGQGEGKKEKEENPQYIARWWVEEVCHSWVNRFRKRYIRWGCSKTSVFGTASFENCGFVGRRPKNRR